MILTIELKTILIDLDETLIHTEDFVYGNSYDYVFEMDNPTLAPKKDVDNRLPIEDRSLLSTISN